MPRKGRNLIDGGLYHIISRGHNKQDIFRDALDCTAFKKFIHKYLTKYRVEIYHYVIMPNHFHFLSHLIKAEDLPKFMQGLCQVYAQYYNKKYQTIGYIFQDRYKSIPIEDERHLLECARYIERNPVRAGITTDLCNYLHSSYPYYAKGMRDSLIVPDPAYLDMGSTPLKKQRAYIEYANIVKPYEEILDEKLQILR